jgi:hypothetical protein
MENAVFEVRLCESCVHLVVLGDLNEFGNYTMLGQLGFSVYFVALLSSLLWRFRGSPTFGLVLITSVCW